MSKTKTGTQLALRATSRIPCAPRHTAPATEWGFPLGEASLSHQLPPKHAHLHWEGGHTAPGCAGNRRQLLPPPAGLCVQLSPGCASSIAITSKYPFRTRPQQEATLFQGTESRRRGPFVNISCSSNFPASDTSAYWSWQMLRQDFINCSISAHNEPQLTIPKQLKAPATSPAGIQ